MADHECPLLEATEKNKSKFYTLEKLFPILKWSKTIQRGDIIKDLLAGVTVGVLLIPQSMSYAALAHLPPQYGLYTGFIPLIIFTFLTSSYHISVGPVAPVCVLVGSALEKIVGSGAVDPETGYGNDQFQAAASGLSLVVGIILIMMAVLRLGFIVKYLSVPVMTGFVTGAAFIIFGNQLRAFFGLNCARTSYFYTTLYDSLAAMDTYSWRTTLLSVLSLLFLSGCKYFNAPRWFPAPFILMLVTTVLSYGCNFKSMGIKIVGDLPAGIPTPQAPTLIAPHLMISEGFIVAIVAYVGSLGLAKSLARDSPFNYEVNANSELVAYGTASVIGSLFLGFPPSGSFSRSALCFEMEARTPLHGIFTACLMCAALYVTAAFKFLPKCVLSTIIVMSVRRLFLNGWKELSYLAKARSIDFIECFACMAAVCFLGITDGIVTGAVLSLFNYIYKTSFTEICTSSMRLNRSGTDCSFNQDGEESAEYNNIQTLCSPTREQHMQVAGGPDMVQYSKKDDDFDSRQIAQELKIIQPKAGIYYANVTMVVDSVKKVVKSSPAILELDLMYSPFLDSTSARMLLDCLADATKNVGKLIISNCCDNVQLDLNRYARLETHEVVLQVLKIKTIRES